jgi:lysophospholipase L1-like esterase
MKNSASESPGLAGRLARWALRLALLAVLTLVAAEALLQIGAQLVGDRSETTTGTGRITIIGVGDSHMYGALVEENESFPAQLQAALDEQEPGRFAVVNLGVPGMNTAQVRNRFVENLTLYQPDIVLVWCGVNNMWNRSEIDSDPDGMSLLDAYARRSRLYRMYQVWRHNRDVDQAVAAPLAESRAGATKYAGPGQWKLRHGGREETIAADRYEENRTTKEVYQQAYHDFLEMARWAGAAGVKIAFVGYPVAWAHFAPANRAMRQVADETAAIFIPTGYALERIPKEDAQLLAGAHPNAVMYREFARDAAPQILELVR